MIISIFVVMLLIVVLLLGVGYPTNQIYMLFLAYGLLFVLAVVLMTSGIDYATGKNITEVGATTVVTDTFSVYSDARMGLYLAVISVAAFTVTAFQWRRISNTDE